MTALSHPDATFPVDGSTPQNSSVVIIGHRGSGATALAGDAGAVEVAADGTVHYQQNTRASFLAAHAAGASWVELDLLPSADGDLMLRHDTHLAAYGDPRAVWEASTADLIAYGVEPFDGLCTDLPSGLGLYLDIKATPGDVDPTYGPSTVALTRQWVREHGAHRPLLAAAFNPFAVADLTDAGLHTGWIVSHGFDLHTAVMSAARARIPVVIVHGTAFGAPEGELERAMCLARENKLTVWVWGATMPHLPVLRELGITGFCVDDIRAAVQALA